MQDLDQNLAETFEPIDRDSPTKNTYTETMFFEKVEQYMPSSDKKHSKRDKVLRSETNDFITCNNLEQETSKVSKECSYQSLGLCEPSTSHGVNIRQKQKLPVASGSLSLPYYEPAKVKPSSTLIPVRNQFTDKTMPSNVAKESLSSNARVRSKKESCDSGVCSRNRTYDNEEGPFSFSGESSFSEEQNDLLNKEDVVENGVLKMHFSMSDVDEKDRCSTEDVSDSDEQCKWVRYGCGKEEVLRKLPQVDALDRKCLLSLFSRFVLWSSI